MNRAYVWLSDGTVVGYRDLDTGLDHFDHPQQASVLAACVQEWLDMYGVPCGRLDAEASTPLVEPGGGVLGWWRRRQSRRREARAESARWEWRLDHPLWRVPIDAPNGDWRDLVRNAPGQALWEHLATLPPPGFFDVSGRQAHRAWHDGARGEESLAAELWRIARPGHWRFIHSVPVGTRGSDIDHVLVGPAGVFTINTKNHRGSNVWVAGNTFMVNGQRQPYIRNSRHEALRAGRVLSRACGFPVPVRGVIAVIDPRQLTVKEHPNDVAVTTRRQLSRWLARQPLMFSPEQAEAIFSAARRSSTWGA